MLCINWNKMILIPLWIRHTNLWARQERHWDPLGLLFNTTERQNVCYWWRWNRRPVDHPNDRCFSIHHALQEGNKLSPSVFLEKRKSLEPNIFMVLFMPYKICIFRIYASKALGGLCNQREVKPIAIKESQQRWYLLLWIKRHSKTFDWIASPI
jgi:hypothetical protein